jgi:hypothetical protein
MKLFYKDSKRIATINLTNYYFKEIITTIIVVTTATFTRAIRIITIITTICKDALNILVAYNSKIVINTIYLVYVRFIVN